MLGQSGYSRAMLPNVRGIERRLRLLEQQLERVGGRSYIRAHGRSCRTRRGGRCPRIEQHR